MVLHTTLPATSFELYSSCACRLPSSANEDDLKRSPEAEGDNGEGLDLRCNWEDSNLTAAQDVARGKQILAGQGIGPSQHPGYESSRQEP